MQIPFKLGIDRIRVFRQVLPICFIEKIVDNLITMRFRPCEGAAPWSADSITSISSMGTTPLIDCG